MKSESFTERQRATKADTEKECDKKDSEKKKRQNHILIVIQGREEKNIKSIKNNYDFIRR